MDVAKSLTERFSAPLKENYKRRIIFWHDPDREFEQTIDEIAIPNVKVLKLTGSNNFYAKMLLSETDQDSDYLVYNPISYKDVKDNWLLDIECYSEEFRADMLSIRMAEYNMPNNSAMRKALKLYNKFFENKERAGKLASLHSDYTSAGQLHIDIIAVLSGTSMNTASGVIRALLLNGLNYDENPAVKNIQKFGNEAVMWELINRYTGFERTEGATFDGLYCGFLGSVEQIEIVRDFLQSPMMKAENAKPLFLLDPVMGDNGRAHSTITPEHCEKMKELAALADILTPNITEACLLADTPYKEGRFADYELTEICRKLTARHARVTGSEHQSIVITGLLDHKRFLNYVWENGKRSVYSTEIVGKSWHGTGDIFASILAAGALHEVPLMQSVKKAADFISLCIRGSEEAGVPEKDGVLFEKYLCRLADM